MSNSYDEKGPEIPSESDPENSLNLNTPHNVIKASVNLPKLDKKKSEVLTPQTEQPKSKKVNTKSYSKYVKDKEYDNNIKESNNSGVSNNNEPLEINCLKKSNNNIPTNNIIPIDENNNENPSQKFDRRTQSKTSRKRDLSTDNQRESSCTNRRNRDKSLYASHNISTITPSDM